jgi:hypothetical protein
MSDKHKIVLMHVGLASVVVAVLIGGGFAATPSYGQAQTSMIHFQEPFDFEGIPLCGGEPVTLRGTTYWVVQETITPDGKRIEQTHLITVQGTATTASGQSYPMTGAQMLRSNSVSATVSETVIAGTLIVPGQPNTGFQLVYHTTISPNGEISSDVVKEDTRCVG